MKKTVLFVLTLAVLAGGFGAGMWYARRTPPATASQATGARRILYYVDPMHPSYRSDKPGIAPDCGMKLEPVYEDGTPPAGSPAKPQGKVLYYRDPKNPDFHSAQPGLNPETGNDLEPVYEGSAAPLPPGVVNVSAEKQQLIGVRFAAVEAMSGGGSVRANGKVTQDETKITRVHPKIEGWIQKVHVDFTGQFVRRGDPLLTVYSPEMLATQQEFLLALRARDAMKTGANREAYENSEILIEAARRRLELWDFNAAQVDEVERTRKPIRSITISSPASGYVMARNAFPSQKVSPETELYAIADLSRVWIMADVFESDLPKIQTGRAATITLPYENGRTLNAKVSYIQPLIDPATRTAKIRLDAPNPGLSLKPDMFVQVEFQIAAPSQLSVPADAVVNTGMRKTVFVDLGNGNLEPRRVETGQRIGDRVQITAGLRPGERVVAAGAFLIDSEAQLKNPQPAGHQHD